MSPRRLFSSLLACSLLGCPPADLTEQQRCNWTQWGQGPQHQGQVCVPGQSPDRLLARIAYDPLSGLEGAEAVAPGDPPELIIHYPSPLTVEDEVYLVVKGGDYLSCEPPGSGSLADGGACGNDTRSRLSWSLKAYRWAGDSLVERWTYPSDWKPLPASLAPWEPPLQPAIGGDSVWVPGAGGTLDEVRRADGVRLRRVDPFADPGYFAVSGVAVGVHGDVYYAAMKVPPEAPFSSVESALVRVSAAGEVHSASYPSLVPGAPDAGAACAGIFRRPGDVRPYPPVDDAGVLRHAPVVPCTAQRPAVSAVPAVGPDGTVYVVSRAHDNQHYGYLVAVGPELQPRWAASLRDRLSDGCGVAIPINPPGVAPSPALCREGTPVGVDPFTNLPPAALVNDLSSASPTIFPDGTVAYGSVSTYNIGRGHLMHFSAAGAYLGNYDFGWDLTPATWTHDGTFSVVVKDNHYGEWDPTVPPSYFLTRLDATLHPVQRFRNTNTLSCGEDGGCVDDHPDGFEWCISAPAVDSEGSVFGNSEDGNLYVVGADGGQRARHFLKLAIGAAYTPIALDAKGRIYTMNGGDLFVLGH